MSQFKWSQNATVVIVQFSVSPTVRKEQVDVHITGSSVKAGIKGSSPICEVFISLFLSINTNREHFFLQLNLDLNGLLKEELYKLRSKKQSLVNFFMRYKLNLTLLFRKMGGIIWKRRI